MSQVQLISFESISAGATVRVTCEKPPRISVIDLIMVVCAQSRPHATVTYNRLKDSEVITFCYDFQFPGQGQRPTPVAALQEALQIMMVLPGEKAKTYRKEAAEILTRFLAGDATLHEEIQANAASAAPINVVARESLKRPLDDVQAERKVRMCLAVEAMHFSEKCFEMLVKHGLANDRDKLVFGDQVRSTSLIVQSMGRVEESAPAAPAPLAPVTISSVAAEMGLAREMVKADWLEVGRAVSEAYFKKHGARPAKHTQFVDGAVRPVNSYTTADEGLIREAIAGRMI